MVEICGGYDWCHSGTGIFQNGSLLVWIIGVKRLEGRTVDAIHTGLLKENFYTKISRKSHEALKIL